MNKIRLARAVVIGLGAVAYFFLCYRAAAASRPTLFTTLLGLAPLLLAALAFSWNSRARSAALLLLAALGALLWRNFEVLQSHAAWLYFLQHAGTMSALALTFGATLAGDPAQALCSRIARRLDPDGADPALLRYTWKVTLAWTLFFAASALASLLLFTLAPLEFWSAFANLGTPLLVAAMFAGEIAIRARLLPGRRPIGLGRILAAYRAQTRKTRA